ncbi:MAG: hypothetical protein E7355_03865 [Clostridiales bacterium]|nr:hypothetical protein [Clostridiales bacterium]
MRDDTYPDGSISWAAQYAVMDEIREKGYLFSGWQHQEAWAGCPVLNDGKIRRFSQRGFAQVMAEAHGETGVYDYARYMDFSFSKKDGNAVAIMPKSNVDKNQILDKKALCETFALTVDETTLSKALETRVLTVEDAPQFRYLDTGDVLTITDGKHSLEIAVAMVDRKKDLTKEQHRAINSMYALSSEQRQQLEEEIRQARLLLTIRLQQEE